MVRTRLVMQAEGSKEEFGDGEWGIEKKREIRERGVLERLR